MKYLLSLIFLLVISIANAETVIRYTHVYDIDANGAKLKCNSGTTYLIFNDNKTQFYGADNPEGIVESYERPFIYKFEKTVNGIHYYYRDVDYENCSNGFILEYLRRTMKFLKGREYVYFSNDFSKFNWFVLDKGDKEYYVYEKYKEPAKRQAPSSLY